MLKSYDLWEQIEGRISAHRIDFGRVSVVLKIQNGLAVSADIEREKETIVLRVKKRDSENEII